MAKFSVGYKHKTVNRFTVRSGDTLFEFKNGVLRIEAETQEELDAKNEMFENALRGFQVRDRNAIVKLKVLDNEISAAEVLESRAVRGPVDTAAIKAPIRSQNAGTGQGAPTPPAAAPTLNINVKPE
jgi:hypothetical protein